METKLEKINIAETYRLCCDKYGWTYSTKGFLCFCSLWGLRKRWRK